MACSHRGFHRITSQYDRQAGVLVYLSFCESCGASLGEVNRMPYRPRFERAADNQTASAAPGSTSGVTADHGPA
jgi:hypothetical protein